MLQHASLLLLIFHPRQAAGGDEDDDGKGAGAGQEKESSGCAYFSGWPFQDGEEYETSDSDDFDDDESEEDGEEGAAAGVAAAEAAGGLEQLAERRRAMPPLDYVAKEPGGDDGKCNVVLCPCIEERCRVRKLLCLLHTIAGDDSACMLANACWDTTRPEAVPAVQAKAADSSIVDDAVAVQLPVTQPFNAKTWLRRRRCARMEQTCQRTQASTCWTLWLSPLIQRINELRSFKNC
jgi:hypothetical protein